MIFQKKALSDDDYIDMLRKRDRLFRRMRWVWFGSLVALAGTLLLLSRVVLEFTATVPENERGHWTGLVLGFGFGFMFVILCAQAGKTLNNWTESRNGFRTERLLIQYHDRLKELESAGNPEREKSS